MVLKEKYKYFGSGEIQSENVYFHKFGQELALTDAQAFDCAKVGGILTSEEFANVGWTPSEKSDKRFRKGPDFDARMRLALAKRKVLIEELQARLAVSPLILSEEQCA